MSGLNRYLGAVLITVMTSLVFSVAATADEKKIKPGQLFRYKNDQGTLVTSHILPPDRSQKGYQVVTIAGDVLETVAPAPTEEEKKKILSAIDQEKYDKSLMLRYGTLADLLKAQKRKKDEIASKLSVLTSNQSNIRLQIDAEQSKAANYERQGKPIPEPVLVSLEGLWGNLEKTEDALRVINKELADENARFDQEINRYKELKGLK